jgi:hypothetical protein
MPIMPQPKGFLKQIAEKVLGKKPIKTSVKEKGNKAKLQYEENRKVR